MVFLSLLSMLIMILMVLLSVAFFTLFERKLLGVIQLRKGPDKLGLLGVVQPFSDAMKLFSKEMINLVMLNYYIYLLSPMFILINALLIWLVIPFYEVMFFFKLGFLFLLSCLGLNVFMLMFMGWSSNSNYAMLGGFRAIIQVISYEVSLIFIMMNNFIFLMDFNLMEFDLYQNLNWFIMFLYPLSLMMFLSMLAETNRSPLDFAEGESELVSGFNIEYGGALFAMIFLAEYSMIMFMSFLFSIMFLGFNFGGLLYIKMLFMMFLFILMRGCLPRYRYDKLMYLNWKIYLPISLVLFMFYFSFKFLMNWNF
nr:NADH dehydrogenase subunit 1 [Paduniella sp. LP-2022]